MTGRTLGPFVLESVLGSGLTVVYRAVDQRVQQPRAVKLLPPTFAQNPQLFQYVEDQVRRVTLLQHPHILTVYEMGVADGIAYVAMELVEGHSLGERLRTQGVLIPDLAIWLLDQLADVLDTVHAQGLIHGDLKPSNLLIRADNHLLVADFGVGRAVQLMNTGPNPAALETAQYQAPEVIRGQALGPSIDAYALGVLGYTLLVGRPPFIGDLQQVRTAHVQQPPPPPRHLRFDLAPATEAILLRQLGKTPQERFASAKEYVAALAASVGGPQWAQMYAPKSTSAHGGTVALFPGAPTIAATLPPTTPGYTPPPGYTLPASMPPPGYTPPPGYPPPAGTLPPGYTPPPSYPPPTVPPVPAGSGSGRPGGSRGLLFGALAAAVVCLLALAAVVALALVPDGPLSGLAGRSTATAIATTVARQPSPTAASGGSSLTPGPAGGDQTLTMYASGRPDNLDPALNASLNGITLIMQLMDGLTLIDSSDLSAKPGLAQSWQVSPDGKTYTFRLREGLVWSNGDPLTAEDFVYAWRRALDPKVDHGQPSPYAYQLYPIRGAQRLNTQPGTDPATLGVRAVDPRTLEVTLEHPTPYFLFLTGFPTLYPVNRKAVEADPQGWATPGKMVVSGPFVPSAVDSQNNLILTRNPRYWNARNVRLERVTLITSLTLEEALAQYRAGQIQYSRAFYLPALNEFRGNPELKVVPLLNTTYLLLNVTRPPLNDVRVRRALSLVLDRPAIANLVSGGVNRGAYSFVAPGIPGYEPANLVTTDVAMARQLLAQAGYPGGQGFPPLQFLVANNLFRPRDEAIGNALRTALRNNLGIELRVTVVSVEDYFAAQERLTYQIMVNGWGADYPDAMTFLAVFRSGSGNNHTGWTNATYEQLLQQADETTDASRRTSLLQQAEQLLVRTEVPIIPLYYEADLYLIKPNVQGLATNPLSYYDLRTISLAP